MLVAVTSGIWSIFAIVVSIIVMILYIGYRSRDEKIEDRMIWISCGFICISVVAIAAFADFEEREVRVQPPPVETDGGRKRVEKAPPEKSAEELREESSKERSENLKNFEQPISEVERESNGYINRALERTEKRKQ